MFASDSCCSFSSPTTATAADYNVNDTLKGFIDVLAIQNAFYVFLKGKLKNNAKRSRSRRKTDVCSTETQNGNE